MEPPPQRLGLLASNETCIKKVFEQSREFFYPVRGVRNTNDTFVTQSQIDFDSQTFELLCKAGRLAALPSKNQAYEVKQSFNSLACVFTQNPRRENSVIVEVCCPGQIELCDTKEPHSH